LYRSPSLLFYFFFSSRRRHTRFSRDWSSDVCSSDLPRKLSNKPRKHQKRRLPSRSNQRAAKKKRPSAPNFWFRHSLATAYSCECWVSTKKPALAGFSVCAVGCPH